MLVRTTVYWSTGILRHSVPVRSDSRATSRRCGPPPGGHGEENVAVEDAVGWELVSNVAPEDRDQVGDALQQVLVALVDVSLQTKQLHWNVVGRNFSALHLQLDTLARDTRVLADEVAERSVMVGFPPSASAGDVAQYSPLVPVTPGVVLDEAVVVLVTRHLGQLSALVRSLLPEVAVDPLSEDVLVRAGQLLEKHYWMWQALGAPSLRRGLHAVP